MRPAPAFATALLLAACLGLHAQAPPTREAPGEAHDLPPRASATDYLAHVQAGTLTIAAEFKGHSIPTAQGPLTSEEYVSVELGLFGPPEARTTISVEHFSLRINGKKTTLPGLPYGMVVGNLKDPEYEQPEAAEKKSKTSMGSKGGGQDDAPPAVVKIPVPVLRAMAQRTQRAALPEGDRALPQAGLIFFQYRGKTDKLRSIELLYDGPAGKATLALQP